MLNVKDYQIRLRWSSIGSFALALGKIILACMSFSIFLGINGIYTAIVAYGKHLSLIGMRTTDAKKDARHYYKRIGVLILVASIIYLIYTARLLQNHTVTHYSNYMGITIAAVTFFEMGMSIAGIYRARKQKDLMKKAIKMLNLCSALIGLVLTQTALLSFTAADSATGAGVSAQDLTQAATLSFSHLNQSGANAMSGFLFGSITGLIGLWMMVRRVPDSEMLHGADSTKK